MPFDIISSAVMGGAIFATDVILKPQFNDGFSEVLRFGMQAIVCEVVYTVMGSNRKTPISYSLEKNLKSTGVAALVLSVSDKFLRPEMFKGMGTEMFKFGIQGAIVNYTLGMIHDKQAAGDCACEGGSEASGSGYGP